MRVEEKKKIQQDIVTAILVSAPLMCVTFAAYTELLSGPIGARSDPFIRGDHTNPP
jgi:hypothetical protein